MNSPQLTSLGSFKCNFRTPEQICALLQIVFDPLFLALLDLDKLRLRPNSMPKPGGLTEFVSDLLVSVQLKDGDELGIHLLFEHKSAPDRRLMFQLAKYTVNLHENEAELMVPVTLYHGRADWQPHSFADKQYAGQPTEVMGHIGNVLLNIGHFFVNLRKETVQVLLRRLPLQPALALEIMAYVWDADALQYAKWMDRAARLERSLRQSFIDATKDYLWRVRPSIKMTQVRQLMQQAKQAGDEDMQEAIDMWEKHQPDSAEEVWTIAL